MSSKDLYKPMNYLSSIIILIMVSLTVGWLMGLFNFDSLSLTYLVLLVLLTISVNVVLVINLVQNQGNINYEH